MINAKRIVDALDARLNACVDLTLYGRAALVLGFVTTPQEYMLSKDVDVVLWLGQAEELARGSNFWEAVERVNQEFAGEGLYVSHLFEEDQVVLLPGWRQNRVKIEGPWARLDLHRLGDLDLLLSKLMRNDPTDQSDARFIIQRAGLHADQIVRAIRSAKVPSIPEVEEEFMICSKRLLTELNAESRQA